MTFRLMNNLFMEDFTTFISERKREEFSLRSSAPVLEHNL